MADINSEGTVLLIDDEPDFRKVASLRLSKQGNYHVVTAPDGEAGLTAARAGHPDVILLDLMMPKMNGHEVLQHLKNDPKTKDIPVIMLSAVGEQQQMAISLKFGAACHLTKPYDLNELFKELKLAVTRHRDAHKPAS